jgi:hypothetical protein
VFGDVGFVGDQDEGGVGAAEPVEDLHDLFGDAAVEAANPAQWVHATVASSILVVSIRVLSWVARRDLGPVMFEVGTSSAATVVAARCEHAASGA